MVVVADRLAGGTAGSSFFAGGVIAFYSVVVLGISRVVRSSLGGTRYHLVPDEMPHTRGGYINMYIYIDIDIYTYTYTYIYIYNLARGAIVAGRHAIPSRP